MKWALFSIALALAAFAASLAFSQTEWQKYEGNPVLVPTESWEFAGVIGPRVLKTGNHYKMWYSALGSRRQIALATSEDGIHWTKSPNPVLSIGESGDFDSQHVTYGMVLIYQDQYWMWYSGHNGRVWQIGLATSPDGIHWTKYAGNPVLTVGESGEWDESGVIAPAVNFDGHSFKMWYNGNGYPFIQAGGYAESPDGIHWEKHPDNPVFTPVPSDWESQFIGMNTLMFADGLYHLWYGAAGQITNGIGYATSKDGIKWERYEGNPIVKPGGPGEWDSVFLGGFFVLRENDSYKMWYSGRKTEIWQIGYAESKKEDSQGNYALSFDGSDDIVGLPPNFISTPEAITMEAWVKYSSEKTHMMALSLEGVYAFYLNRFETGTFTPFFDGASINGNDFGYGANLNNNQWHHLAAVHAHGILKVFVDGVLVGSVEESLYDLNSLDRASAIGAQFDGSEFHFDGIVDEVRMWNLARTPDEIRADMHRPLVGNEPGLIGYWRCDEGHGQILHDASSYGNHGQLGFSPHEDVADPQWVLANRNATGCQGIPLPAASAYGNIRGGDQSHSDQVTYCFSGQPGDMFLSFQAYDIDTQDEVDVLLNGTKVFDVPVTPNNAWGGLFGVLLPNELIDDLDDNELVFDNTTNPPKNSRWGVRRVSVDPFFALPSAAAYGRIHGGDHAHADKVVYFFSGQPGDLNMTYEVYDIDGILEVDIILNGVKIHDVARTSNNQWSPARTLLLPDAFTNDAGINVLIFDNTSNPPRESYWGVRNVSVAPTSNSSIALNFPHEMSISGSLIQDGHYLNDGQSTPPARPEGDDPALPDSDAYTISGATTIGVNGQLTIDFITLQQFDYLVLHPEWHPSRYFGYRIEASMNGQEWHTLINKTSSFIHGTQIDPVPDTQARFLRISGASVIAEMDSLEKAELEEEAYWQIHDELINQVEPSDLAIAELVLLRQQGRVNVSNSPSASPLRYHLAQNFPNPFNPSTTIRFEIPRSGQVQLALYNLRGELVRTIVKGELPAGVHTYTFDMADLASGMYFYQLQADDFTVTRKMVLLKDFE
jgi:predicted GH43/DUF377 family glycosyl hydrolase